MKSEHISKKILFYYLYTIAMLFLPLTIRLSSLYNLPGAVCVFCFVVSFVIIVALENSKMLNMLKKDCPDIYAEAMNGRKNNSWAYSYFQIDSFFWLNEIIHGNARKTVWDVLKEEKPQYWEYSLQLRIYITVSFVLVMLSIGLLLFI